MTGIDAGSYTREQAAELLASTYFADRAVVSLQQAEGCTTGDETRLTRTYRLTTQAGGKTVDGTLTLTLHKKKIDDKTSAWFLGEPEGRLTPGLGGARPPAIVTPPPRPRPRLARLAAGLVVAASLVAALAGARPTPRAWTRAAPRASSAPSPTSPRG